MKRRLVAILLLVSVFLTGCACKCRNVEVSGSLTEDIEANPVSSELDITKKEIVADFAVSLFQNSLSEDGDTLISPMSVLYALAMTANGAKGETLAQMEEMFGVSVGELNEFLHAYMSSLPQTEKYKLCLANAIWFRDSEEFHVNEAFLQANADYYGAGLYKGSFDSSTADEINAWVSEHTEQRIQKIVDEISGTTMMYLINALAFDAEWDEIYQETQVRDSTFTQEDGEREIVEFMYSEEGKYLQDEKATGFVKYYKDKKYAFVALLPREGVTVDEYVASLKGDALYEMLGSASEEKVKTAIPKFQSEYTIEMKNVLKKMGMQDAFQTSEADLSGIGSLSYGDNLYISSVRHKTYISVNEKGTEAGAVTAVAVDGMSAMMTEPKKVYLDRPFVYMIIDCEVELPIFMGTVKNIPGTK